MWCSCHDTIEQIEPIGGPDVLQLLRKSGGHTDMYQAKNKKKFRIAGSLACPAAVDRRWF